MSANCRVVALRQKDLLVRPAPGPHGATGWPAADRWGANYLRAPSFYRVVVKRCGDKLVRLGDVARVRRGVTTGANGFFFLDRHEQMHWGIEKEYLAEALRTPRQWRHIWLNHDREELDYLFVCRKGREELQGSSALEYIKHGESKGIHQRPTLKARSRWWDVGRPTGTYVHASYLVDSVMRFYASESPQVIA